MRTVGRAITVGLAAALAAVTLTACGNSDGSKQAAGSTTAPTTTAAKAAPTTPEVATGAPVASKGCKAAPTAAAHLDRRNLTVAGVDRFYLVSAPVAATPPKPMPLVLDFHGLIEGAQIHSTMSGFGDLAEQEGFVAAFPNGTGNPAHWAAGPAGPAAGPNADLDYTAAMLDQIEAAMCIDVSRVYATGLSNGAMFDSLLACRMADRFAAFAPVAGATNLDGCAPAKVMPLLAFHGTADPILLFNGGVGDIVKLLSGGAGTTLAPTTTLPVDLNGSGYPANVKAWAVRNKCKPTPTDTEVSKEVTLRTYACPAGADVEMYIIHGGGHAWPGSQFSKGIAKVVGYTTFDIDATKLIWAFFKRFQRT